MKSRRTRRRLTRIDIQIFVLLGLAYILTLCLWAMPEKYATSPEIVRVIRIVISVLVLGTTTFVIHFYNRRGTVIPNGR
jgi:hypothetical protein